MNLVVNTVQ